MKKDNIWGIVTSAVFGTVGAMGVYSFDVKSLIAGIAGAIGGAAIGAALKETRRGVMEKRPKNFILPYIGGAAIASGLAAGMWFAL